MSISDTVLNIATIGSIGATVYFLYDSYFHRRDLQRANQLYLDVTTSFGSIDDFTQRLVEKDGKAIVTAQELTDVVGRLYPRDLRKNVRLTEFMGAITNG